MTPDHNTPPRHDGEEKIRDHVFDGIAEYDKRLPNWWLLTFYGAIVFAIVYWMATQHFPHGNDQTRVAEELQRIEAAKLSSAEANLDDPTLWQMSRNPVFVSAGKDVFNANCAACHLASLRGKSESPTAIGPDLTDNEWLYGAGKPLDLLHTVANGTAKGMPAWGPVLGAKKVSQAVSYVLSHHEEPK